MRWAIWIRRFFALLLMIGGIGGVIVMLSFGKQAISQFQDTYTMLLYLIIWLIYLACLGVGIGLWVGQRKSCRAAVWLFLSQVPFVGVPRLTFDWYLGLQIGPVIWFQEAVVQPSYIFLYGIGATFSFHNWTPDSDSVPYVGINLAALLAVILLIKTNRALGPDHR